MMILIYNTIEVDNIKTNGCYYADGSMYYSDNKEVLYAQLKKDVSIYIYIHIY